MGNAQLTRIETRAQRITTKALALGFTKNGSPMVIDQAREIVAAEEGFRNWHALRASLNRNADGKVQIDLCSSLLAALEVAATALDQMANGADFDRVVDETGVTYRVLTAIRDAKAAGRAPGPTYEDMHRVLFAIGSQNDVWTQRDFMDKFVNGVLKDARDVLGMEINGAGDLVPVTEKASDAYHLTKEAREEAQEQGWHLFASPRSTSEAHGDVIELQIQRDDESGVFEDDDAAWLFVVEEAHLNPESAAATALQILREHSLDEYRRIELFDRKNKRLLPQRPMSSAGHLVDVSDVAEWVGLHHQVNFDTAGARQQEWIDRFVASHNDEDRFATYLVAQNWSHIFVGKTDSITRWVYRLGSVDEGVVFAQILGEMGRWHQLDRVAISDLQESIHDNDIPDTYLTAWSSEVEAMPQLPAWAQR